MCLGMNPDQLKPQEKDARLHQIEILKEDKEEAEELIYVVLQWQLPLLLKEN